MAQLRRPMAIHLDLRAPQARVARLCHTGTCAWGVLYCCTCGTPLATCPINLGLRAPQARVARLRHSTGHMPLSTQASRLALLRESEEELQSRAEDDDAVAEAVGHVEPG